MEVPTCLLLVEDDDDHAEVVSRALAGKLELHRVSDGEEALDYVFRREKYADEALSPEPGLILLDLRLPKMNGLDVLKTIKTSAEKRHIPCVIMTTSEAERDILSAYRYYANGYLVKPLDFRKFSLMMDSVGEYWMEWNRKPVKTS
jgi:two-component system, response regulator